MAVTTANEPQIMPGLSIEDRARNYQLFDELMKKGVKLDTLIKEAENNRRPAQMDAGLFSVMEATVKGCPAVASARAEVDALRDMILNEILMKDARYKSAYEAYHNIVSTEYVKNRESADVKTQEEVKP